MCMLFFSRASKEKEKERDFASTATFGDAQNMSACNVYRKEKKKKITSTNVCFIQN